MALAGALAWLVAERLGAERPVFAVLVPLVALKDDPYAALNLSLTRLAGVVAGVAIGLGVVRLLGLSTLAVGVILTVGLIIGTIVRFGPDVNNQVAVSALLLVVATDRPERYAFTRIWETVVGALVALAAAVLVFPANPLGRLRDRTTAITAHIMSDLVAADLILRARDGAAAEELLRDATTHVKDAASAVDDGRRALDRINANLLRRGDAPALRAQVDDLVLLRDIARQVRRLGRDLGSFADLDDQPEQWKLAAVELPQIGAAIREAVSRRIARQDAGAAIATADARMAGYRASDESGRSAIMRRPYVLMIERLRAS